jgi:hypothetical protein
MATPTGWISSGPNREPLCGANNPYGREDTANQYARALWTNFIAEHNQDDGTHKTGGLAKIETGTYTSSAGDKTVSLTDSNLSIDVLLIVGDLWEQPVMATSGMTANNTKEFGTAALQSDSIKSIATDGEFTVGQGDEVNAQGSTETYYYVAIGT